MFSTINAPQTGPFAGLGTSGALRVPVPSRAPPFAFPHYASLSSEICISPCQPPNSPTTCKTRSITQVRATVYNKNLTRSLACAAASPNYRGSFQTLPAHPATSCTRKEALEDSGKLSGHGQFGVLPGIPPTPRRGTRLRGGSRSIPRPGHPPGLPGPLFARTPECPAVPKQSRRAANTEQRPAFEINK